MIRSSCSNEPPDRQQVAPFIPLRGHHLFNHLGDTIPALTTRLWLKGGGPRPLKRMGAGDRAIGVALLWLGRRAWRAVVSLERRALTGESRLGRALRIQELRLVEAEDVRAVTTAATGVRGVLLGVTTLILYAMAVLALFPWTDDRAREMAHYLGAALWTAWQAAAGYLPKVVSLVLIALVAWLVTRFLKLLSIGVARGAVRIRGFEPEWATPTYRLAAFIVFSIAFTLAFPYLPGSDSEAFRAMSIFLGILISLSSTSAVANIVAGTMLTYAGAFRVGGFVKIGDTLGEVTAKKLLVTRVRTIKHVDVAIPNSVVLGTSALNYSRLARDVGSTGWRRLNPLEPQVGPYGRVCACDAGDHEVASMAVLTPDGAQPTKGYEGADQAPHRGGAGPTTGRGGCRRATRPSRAASRAGGRNRATRQIGGDGPRCGTGSQWIRASVTGRLVSAAPG